MITPHFGFGRRIWFWLRIAFAMGLVVVLVGAMDKRVPFNTAEDGFLEVAELGVLGSMVIVWAAAAVISARSPAPLRAGTVAVCIVFTAVSIAGVGRETSWGGIYDLPATTVHFLMVASAIIVVLLFAVALSLVFKRLDELKTFFVEFITSRPMGWNSCGLVLFAIGAAFEENLFGVGSYQLFEEVCELLAYISVIFAALSLISTRGLERPAA